MHLITVEIRQSMDVKILARESSEIDDIVLRKVFERYIEKNWDEGKIEKFVWTVFWCEVDDILYVSSFVFQERTKERLGLHAVGGVLVVPTRIEDVPFRLRQRQRKRQRQRQRQRWMMHPSDKGATSLSIEDKGSSACNCMHMHWNLKKSKNFFGKENVHNLVCFKTLNDLRIWECCIWIYAGS